MEEWKIVERMEWGWCKRKTSKNNRVKYRERIGRGLEGPGEGRGEAWSGRVQGSEAEEKG